MLKGYLVGILCLVTGLASAQSASKSADFLYTNEFSFGARLTTSGWALFGEKAKVEDIYKTRVWQLEFQYFNHPKQSRETAEIPGSINRLRYIYGKQNNFFALHGNFGYRKVIANKADHSGVKLGLTYMVGASLGFQKPYYVDVLKADEPINPGELPPTEPIKYSAETADRFLDKDQIAGHSQMKYGFSDISLVPGAHGKLGLNFDWGANDEIVNALEAGIALDVYYKKVPMMIIERNNPYFVSLYLSFQIGKRWY